MFLLHPSPAPTPTPTPAPTPTPTPAPLSAVPIGSLLHNMTSRFGWVVLCITNTDSDTFCLLHRLMLNTASAPVPQCPSAPMPLPVTTPLHHSVPASPRLAWRQYGIFPVPRLGLGWRFSELSWQEHMAALSAAIPPKVGLSRRRNCCVLRPALAIIHASLS